jgi:hypothetical protein
MKTWIEKVRKTKEKRKTQTYKVFELKIDHSNLSKGDPPHLCGVVHFLFLRKIKKEVKK